MCERPTVGVVLLTMGTRPRDLQRAIQSVLGQQGVSLDVAVVGNGWEPTGLPAGVHGVHLPENLGVPAGRNAGVAKVSGEFILFVDDDARLLSSTFVRDAVDAFRADPGIGLIQPRLRDPERPGEEPSRWIPRMRKGDPARSSNVFSVLEAVVIARRDVFDSVGGWPSPFVYAHEGIELAWRIWAHGHRVVYDGQLEAGHPVTDPSRHSSYVHQNARNRVWLARRNLPWPVSWLYVTSWAGVQAIRWRGDREKLRTWWRGFRQGWRTNPWADDEKREKLSWRGVWRMTRRGRPPVI